MNKFYLVLVVLFLQGNFAFATTCRDAVVEGHAALGLNLERDSFSNAKFTDLGVSVDDFNEMDSEAQEEIYTRIKPMKIMVDSTIIGLNGRINRYAGTFYEVYVLDKLERWRNAVQTLETCTYERD